ncbi:MAG: zinc metallopeptidase [Clostridia bacterium]|nr:zinc metallopeptidase [Clostridia bacterium]
MEELFERAIAFFTDKGVTRGVAIAYIIVSALLIVMAVIALIMRIIVMYKYFDGNKMQTSGGRTCMDVARQALDEAGLKDVKVKRAGFFRALFFGNSYSLSKKTIFLRGTIAKKSSITAVGIAMQKVGIAKLINSGDKMALTRNRLQVISLFGPILLIPVILIGAIIDIVLFRVLGTFSIVAMVVDGVILFAGIVVTLLNMPVEKKGNNMALEMIEKSNILTEEEKIVIRKVFDAYMMAYICEFIMAILRVVQLILEIVMNVQISNSSKE